MTTLAGIEGDGWCVLGSESKITGDGGFMFTPSAKTFENGPVIIGACGGVRGLNILEHGWSAPRYVGKSVEHYLTRTFIPSMRKAMIDAGADMKDDGEVAEFDNALLVAIKGRIFSIGSDYSWIQSSRGVYSYGSGGAFVRGAMSSMCKKHFPKTVEAAQHIITESIKVAIDSDEFSGGKISTFVQYL